MKRITLSAYFTLGTCVRCHSDVDEGPYETPSPLSWTANPWTGFYLIETSVMKELILRLSL